jgi:PAS domain S-box-containing protein
VKHMLLVDDKHENLEYLGALIARSGYRVETARQGEEAFEKAKADPPCLVISDLLMPVMDGYTLLRKWKADPQLREIPFVVYTATYTDPADERLASDLGADAFILKPCEPREFMARIRTALGTPPHAGVPTDTADASHELALQKQYNEALVRKLEHKMTQLEESNRALQAEILERRATAETQIAILDALPSHIALVNSAGLIEAVNQAWRRFAAATRPAAAPLGIGQDYLATCAGPYCLNSAAAAPAVFALRDVLGGARSAFSVEYPCHAREEQRWFRMVVTSLTSAPSSGAVVMHIDITERKLAELHLIQSQEQSYLLLNSTAEGIYGLDLAGRCTFCNPAAARLLGYANPNEIVGQLVHEHHHFLHDDGRPYPMEECPTHYGPLHGNGRHGTDEVFYRSDGSPFPVEYWSHPIRRGEEIVGAVVAFLDNSERRNLEAQFLQSQKMEAVGRLAGGVAHDFNNALQVVATCCELLDEELPPQAPARQYIREMQAAARRSTSLTRQLLAFSRKQVLRPVILNLNEVLEAIREMLQRMIGEDITMKYEYGTDLRPISADQGQIEQILMNLVVNSRDAMPHGGELTIRTANVSTRELALPGAEDPRSDHYVLLRVQDTGSGMDEVTRSRIFEPFFTTKDPGKGTGLGLSTVYGIVKQSGGTIDVQSEVAKGTSVNIHFPMAQAPVPSDSSRPAGDPRTRGSESILLVEDEDALRRLIGHSLRAHGYTVLEAQTGRTAAQIVSQAGVRIDLVVCDVILTDTSGPQVVEQLMKQNPAIRALYVSGYTDDYIAHRGLAGDQPELLEKPFSIDALLSRIRAVLDKPA